VVLVKKDSKYNCRWSIYFIE